MVEISNSVHIFNGVKVHFINHASIKLEFQGKIFYFDPWSEVFEKEAVDYEKADFILITHSHFDHLDPKAVKNLLKEGTVIITEKNSASELALTQNVRILEPGESMSFGKIKIEAVEAYNYKRFKAPNEPFHPKGFGIAFLLHLGNKIFYHAGDTDDIEEMRELENIEVAFLPIGGTYTMDINDALNAVSMIEPKFVVPIHYNFIKGTEANPEEFKEKAKWHSHAEVLIL